MSEQESTVNDIFYVIAAFAIIFPIFWSSIIWLVSQISGWARLAQRYRATLPPAGKRWTLQYGMVGWAGYNGVLTLTPSAEGLFMETMIFFRVGHPRLFIPWGEFREAKVNSFFFRRQVHAKVGFPTVASVRLPAAVFEQTEGRKVLVNRVQG